MAYTTVVVQAGLILRDGFLQPGYVYIVSTAPAVSTGNLGLYAVLEQPGVNPFPLSDVRWCGSLSSFYRLESIDPSHFEGDIRDYLTALNRTYVVYYFANTVGGVRAYAQHASMPRDRFVVYDTDAWHCEQWNVASQFRYLGTEHHSEWA